METVHVALEVQQFAHRFSCSGRQSGKLLFYLVNLKFLSRAMSISNCRKICRQKLLNLNNTHDFVIRPL